MKAISGKMRRSSAPGWILRMSRRVGRLRPAHGELEGASLPCYQPLGLLLVLRLLLEHGVELHASHAQSRSFHVV